MYIPPEHMEIEQLYTQLLSNSQNAIAICSANAGEGVTSIAAALAQRSLLAGESTLLVDLNLHHPASQTLLKPQSETRQAVTLDAPRLISLDQQSMALLGVPSPTRRQLIIELRKPGTLEHYIRQWHQHFDTIIFDTSPLNRINANNIPAQRVAAACDGCLLVVLAGHTTEAMLSAAIEKLDVANARRLGCVFNDRDTPSLKNELLRQIDRLGPRWATISRRLSRWIRRNHLLSLEI